VTRHPVTLLEVDDKLVARPLPLITLIKVKLSP
jgi:hypothetical protein